MNTTTEMPTYVYEEIMPDGEGGETFEFIQSIHEAPLAQHPKTGVPIRRIFAAPNLPTRYTDSETKTRLSNENIAAHGFSRYERDSLTGTYHKTAGHDKEAPSTICPQDKS
jgi:predicted nucleic acid-binding Zn ribbon protein